MVAPGGKSRHVQDLLPRVTGVYHAHSHLDYWVATVKKDDVHQLASLRYDTVTSYCFRKRWSDSRRQGWWPAVLGPLKQAFGVHPSSEGLSKIDLEQLEGLIQGPNCVAVVEIGLDHTW